MENSLTEVEKMEILDQLSLAVQEGEVGEVEKLIHSALNEGMAAKQILDEGLLAAMEVVGEKFQSGEMFLPEVMVAAKAMQSGLDVLKSRLVKEQVKAKGRIILGTVEGDLHDIGKSLVGVMLAGAGFEVIDLGTNVSAQEFVNAAREHNPDLVGMSALLTTTMIKMEETIKALDGAGLRSKGNLKIMVGGAPVTREFARSIGADFYGSDAVEAVSVAKLALGQGKS